MMMHRVPGNTNEQHAASRLWNVRRRVAYVNVPPGQTIGVEITLP